MYAIWTQSQVIGLLQETELHGTEDSNISRFYKGLWNLKNIFFISMFLSMSTQK